jgi:sigma-B regulation protein RsbU (phosphoserine phosphatase)
MGRFRLLLGIFLLFAPAAFLHDLAFHRPVPFYRVVWWSVGVGSVAVASAEILGRSRRLVWVIAIAVVLPPTLLWWDFWLWGWGKLNARVLVEYLLIGYMLLGAYFMLSRFIRNEGATSLRQRTEIALARQVHDALVPPVSFASGSLECYGSSQPASEVGGDLIDVVRANGRVGFYIADVTGHGVPAGVTMSMVKSAIRIRLRDSPPLATLMRDLNDLLIELNRPGVFVTFAAVHLDDAGMAECGLAGHPPLLVHRRATGSLERIEASGPALGIVPDSDFPTQTVRLEPGDMLAAITDGLTEVFDRNEQELGLDHFADAVRSVADRPVMDAHASLFETVRRFGPQTDDQTLLLIRRR